ncbi:ATP-binding cassette domain-containing protein [Azospirillum thiophilum]|uniref:ATP-binding cassette domain-containing protein n=1 Tax=Azospirillum thiophilum TaxID=528244 RepID=UPI000A46C153|nr:ATP-binding cassette domain-containing protein [Azospirillum thiophilum]
MTGGDLAVVLRRLILEADGGEAALRAAAPSLGLRLRRVRLRPGHKGTEPWWRCDHGPLLGFRRADGSPVLLLPDGSGGYRLEGAGDEVHPVDAALAVTLSAEACAPVVGGGAGALTPAGWHSRARAGGTGQGLALPAALGGGIAMALPGAALQAVGERALAGDGTAIGALAAVLPLAALAAGLCERVRRVASAREAAPADLRLHAVLWERLLAVPLGLVQAVPAAVQVERLRDGVTAMQRAVARRRSAVQALAALGPVLAVMGWAAPGPALAGGGLMVAGGLARGWLLRRSDAARRAGAMAMAVSWHRLELAAFGLPQLRLLGAAPWVADLAVSALRGSAAQVRRAAEREADADALGHALALGAPLLVAGLALGEGLGVPNAAGAALATLPAARAVLRLATAFGHLPDRERLEPLRPLLEAPPDSPPGAPDPGPVERLELCGVSFTHPGASSPCLRAVSLSLARGEVVAVAGPSGSGKSTLISLALGLLRPETGVVRVNGRDLATLDAAAYRARIGTVLQDEEIGVETIRSVILGMSPLPAERAWEAARLARLDADIAALPMGIQTLVAEGAFPAGMVQRLLIARALARGSNGPVPDILVLDEATAALDEDVQAALFADLRARGAAVLVASHRPATLALADRVLDLSPPSRFEDRAESE